MDNEQKLTLSGLPPLPKSLSAAATNLALSSATHSNTGSPLNHAQYSVSNDLFMGPSTSAMARQQQRSQRHGSLSSTQESLSDRESIHSRDRESVHSRASSSHSSHHTPTNNHINSDTALGPSNGGINKLDNQIATLRREMYGLRQLDLSLLSQLWALNESIQGFRVFLQEQEALSPPSPSPTPSEANSLTSEAEDDSFAAKMINLQVTQPVIPTLPGGSVTSHASTSSASGASGSSSATSSMGKHGPPAPPAQRTHPQLPRALQQRMRQAPPPPPPPTRTKSTSSNKVPLQHRPV